MHHLCLLLLPLAVCVLTFQPTSMETGRKNTDHSKKKSQAALLSSRVWVDWEHYHIISHSQGFIPQWQVGGKSALPSQKNLLGRDIHHTASIVKVSVCEHDQSLPCSQHIDFQNDILHLLFSARTAWTSIIHFIKKKSV